MYEDGLALGASLPDRSNGDIATLGL